MASTTSAISTPTTSASSGSSPDADFAQEVTEETEIDLEQHASVVQAGRRDDRYCHRWSHRGPSRQGAGFDESIYERCFVHELHLRGFATESQRVVRVEYKGMVFDEPLRFDVLVEGCLLVEGKCVEKILPIHKAQLLSYMKLLDVPVGLLINYHAMVLKDDIHRLILPGSNQP